MEVQLDSSDDPKQLYLDLMKRSLTYLLYGQEALTHAQPRNFIQRMVLSALRKRGVLPMKRLVLDREQRMEGRDWPPIALTMIGMKRLENLQYCVEDVLKNNIEGDLLEAGTWRGGAAILKAYGVTDRSVWVADSFEGLPTPDAERFPADAGYYAHPSPFLSVSLDQVKLAFSRFGLLDDQVRFLKGWFKDTFPTLQDQRWSVLRLDGDMYESTMDSLKYLYPSLTVGGYVIIDDYGSLACCREAVHDYRDLNGITEEIVKVDWTGVYWQRLR